MKSSLHKIIFYVGYLVFADKMNSLKKVFGIAKKREAKDAIITSPTLASTLPPVGPRTSTIIEILPYSFGRG